jgi:hypothetical protein
LTALVNHHFGSKETWFLEIMTASPVLESILAGPIEDLDERAVRALLEARPGAPGRSAHTALVRASDRPEVRRRLQELNTLFVGPLTDRLPGAALQPTLTGPSPLENQQQSWEFMAGESAIP